MLGARGPNDTTYANWAPGEPNDALGEDCAALIPQGWSDGNCLYKGPKSQAVCETDR